MWIDEHPLFLFYLAGCVLVVILTLLKVILFWTVDWVIKANILNKNLKKILPPNDKTYTKQALFFLGLLLVEAALSWINVFVVLWQILSALFRVIRDLFAPTPEEIKLLRFPLRNNPDMPRESVWAYALALQVKAGEKLPNESALLTSLEELSNRYPSFDPIVALKRLENLKVVGSDVISASLNRLGSGRTRVC